MEGEELETLHLYEVQYSDLLLLSSNLDSHFPRPSPEEDERLEVISRTIMKTLGPSGPGLLSVAGVPKFCSLRRALLPLSPKLALLSNEHRKRILKEHKLGSDVSLKNLDRIVSSFAMQIKYGQGHESIQSKSGGSTDEKHNLKKGHPHFDGHAKCHDDELQDLGKTFKELGCCMIDVGLRLAHICDKAIGFPELHQCLLESSTAKGRLMHYHSTLDNHFIKEVHGREKSTKRVPSHRGNRKHCTSNEQNQYERSSFASNGSGASLFGSSFNLWQQWHYDYGIFTLLTAPLFLPSCHSQVTEAHDSALMCCEQGCTPRSGKTLLQIFDPNKNKVFMVECSPESVIVQVGESADILSKGKLRAPLHSVCRPAGTENISRETFAVFLQPAWSKIFYLPDYRMEHLTVRDLVGSKYDYNLDEEDQHKITQEIQKIVPRLSLRLKDGMTFAKFSRETTKQYYGGSGLQSQK